MSVVDDQGEAGILHDIACRRERTLKKMKVVSAVEPVVNTVLVINWPMTAAQPRLELMRHWPKRLTSLAGLLREFQRDPRGFMRTRLNINVRSVDNPRCVMLKNLCEGFLCYQQNGHHGTELDAMNHWADGVLNNLCNLRSDTIGRLPGVGLATVTNLCQRLGRDCAKPDRYVMRVLKDEWKLNIRKCQLGALASRLGVSQLYLDKLLYEYGRALGRCPGSNRCSAFASPRT
jgi:hypothetical protein